MKNLEIICKKNPNILKHFKELQEKDELFDINIVEEIMDIYTKEKNILKNMKFDILKYDNIEKMYDVINEKIRYGKINSFLNNETSLKSREQINKKTFSLLNKILLSDISLDELSEIVFNKINVFRTNNSLNEAIEKFIKSKMDNNVKVIYQNAKNNCNVDLLKIDEDNNILVLKINDFHASKKLGVVAWCISRSENYWNSYVKNNNRYNYNKTEKEKLLDLLELNDDRNQIFIWDLNNKNEMETMIGLTYDKNYEKCYAAHLKNDLSTNIKLNKYLNKNEIMKIKSKNKIDEVDEIIKKINNLHKRKRNISNYIKIFFDIEEYENKYLKKYINLNKENKYEVIKNMNSFLLKKYNEILIPKTNYIFIDDWIQTLEKANEIFPEKMFGLVKASKLLDVDIKMKNQKNYFEKIKKYAEIIESVNNQDDVIFKEDYLFKKSIDNLNTIKINNDSERNTLRKYLNSDFLSKGWSKKNMLFIINNFDTEENILFVKEIINNNLKFDYFKDKNFLNFLSNKEIHQDYFFGVMKDIKMKKEIFSFIYDNNNNIDKELKQKLLYKMINESSESDIKKFLLINKNNEVIENVLSNIKMDEIYNINENFRFYVIENKLKNKITDILNGSEDIFKEIEKYKNLYIPVIEKKYPGIIKMNSILRDKNNLNKKNMV